jgi:tetratricopeptide (TPR) repeat protein
VIVCIGIGILAVSAFRLPAIQNRVLWRVDRTVTYLRNLANPVESFSLPGDEFSGQSRSEQTLPDIGPVNEKPQEAGLDLSPTSTSAATDPSSGVIAETPAPTPGSTPTPLPTLTPTPMPESILLAAPAWEKQDINNCGPASLAMYLRYWGWEGDQFVISDLLKPNRRDRNVNVEELIYYARTRAGWLNAEYRVGGNVMLLKQFLAAGIPVMVEEGVYLDETYWPNDDHWAAHYLLLTGYDDLTQTFIAHDSFFGADQVVSYSDLDVNWRVFNRVVILIYPPDRQDTVQQILGEDWDIATNRTNALEQAQKEIDLNPQDAFAWFNLGSNLVYFERYAEAASAYDRALSLDLSQDESQSQRMLLPQRMLRYQFGPFIAYFHTGRTEDLFALSEYALKRTPNAEEALLWRGWANYRLGKSSAAIQDFYQALEHNPNYQDAKYAIDFVRENP